jgi:hypothetical protein
MTRIGTDNTDRREEGKTMEGRGGYGGRLAHREKNGYKQENRKGGSQEKRKMKHG